MTMAMNHINQLWMDAEPELVKLVACKLCARHGAEIFGFEAVTAEFLDRRWLAFENDARDAIAVVRLFDKSGLDAVEAERKAQAARGGEW
jgi:hypothetical protein